MGIRDLGLSGLFWSGPGGLKKNYGIIPTYCLLIIGLSGAACYVHRLATKSPEVTWNRRTNPEPWNYYSNRQYKFLSSGRDYTKGTPAPKYR